MRKRRVEVTARLWQIVEDQATGSVVCWHVQQFGGESPLANLMEVKA